MVATCSDDFTSPTASSTYAIPNPVPSVPPAEEDEHQVDEIGPDGGRRSRDGVRAAGARRRHVKWLLRAAFEQWWDIGLCGYSPVAATFRTSATHLSAALASLQATEGAGSSAAADRRDQQLLLR